MTGGCCAPHRGSCHGSQLLRVPGTWQQGPALTPVSIPGPGQTTTSPISPVSNPFRDESGPMKTPRDRLGQRCPRAGRSLGLSGASWCCRIRHPDTCGRLSPASPAPSLGWLCQPLPRISCAVPGGATARPLGRWWRPGLHREGSFVGHTGLGQGSGRAVGTHTDLPSPPLQRELPHQAAMDR